MRLLCVSITLLLLAFPTQLLAKKETTKIKISGGNLRTPIEITNPKVLAEFHVHSGPGTSPSEPGYNPNAPGFIIDWSRGAVDAPPKGLQRYQISFFTKTPIDEIFYVVFYEYDFSKKQG